MLGGGDKGAAGALVRTANVEALKAAVESVYPKNHPDHAQDFAVHVCDIVDGITTLDGPLGSEPR
jgi:galactokinase